MTGSEVVAAARGTPEQQAEATSKFAKHFEELLTAGLTLAGASKVEREREKGHVYVYLSVYIGSGFL